jgi:hypothetical protein
MGDRLALHGCRVPDLSSIYILGAIFNECFSPIASGKNML